MPERWHPNADYKRGVTTHRSLPKEKYTIHIPVPSDWKHGGGPEKLPPYAAREISFETTDKTQPAFDLGRIQLEVK